MKTRWKAACLFGGIGGGGLGFKNALEEYKGVVGGFDLMYSIDADPEICEDYENITGSRAVCMDLFSREQYISFHGQEPPEGWQEVTSHDIWKITDGETPDVIFTSPPCKGFSGLLPEESAQSKKYQALNKLTVRSIKLILDAYQDDLPALILLENVPRITTRGSALLNEIKVLLKKAGYEIDDTSHECGEIGGLAQIRKRYLMIARNVQKLPNFVYKPPKRKLKTIGDVLGQLPLPGDVDNGGPMHRMPNLMWKVWVRLALIPAGGDWRDLEKLDHTQYAIAYTPRAGACAVEDWDSPARAVTGGAGFGRSNGASAVNDPRYPTRHTSHYRVERYDGPAHTVTGASHVANGRICISDPKLPERGSRHPGVYQIVRYDETAPTITGTRFGSGALAIQDPRIGCAPRAGTYGVMGWDETGKTIIGAGDIHAGAAAVADPRIPEGEGGETHKFPEDKERGVWIIVAEDGTWHRPLTTFELAALQGFPVTLHDGRPFQLTGKSDAKWRERIGNAVPPQAAQAIAETMLRSLMATADNTFLMSAEDIWVTPDDSGIEEFELVH